MYLYLFDLDCKFMLFYWIYPLKNQIELNNIKKREKVVNLIGIHNYNRPTFVLDMDYDRCHKDSQKLMAHYFQ